MERSRCMERRSRLQIKEKINLLKNLWLVRGFWIILPFSNCIVIIAFFNYVFAFFNYVFSCFCKFLFFCFCKDFHYIKSVSFETVRKYFTYFSFIYESDNFIVEIEWGNLLTATLKQLFNGSENVIMCVSRTTAIKSNDE